MSKSEVLHFISGHMTGLFSEEIIAEADDYATIGLKTLRDYKEIYNEIEEGDIQAALFTAYLAGVLSESYENLMQSCIWKQDTEKLK